MPKKLPCAVKLVAVELDVMGCKQEGIAETLGIDVSTITRAKRNMKDCGDVEGVPKKRGRKAKMDPGMQEVSPHVSHGLIMAVAHCIYFTST